MDIFPTNDVIRLEFKVDVNGCMFCGCDLVNVETGQSWNNVGSLDPPPLKTICSVNINVQTLHSLT